MNLIIDVGNTRVKVAVFEKDTIVEQVISDKEKIIEEVKKINKKFKIDSGIISAVATLAEKKVEELRKIVPILELTHKTKVPFQNLYKTPKTLGVDRIALAAYAIVIFPKKNVLVVDAGTCVTFDFINNKGEYLGGAISPGIEMRYKSLNNYTSKLPLLESKAPLHFIGGDTENCIHSGVVNGIRNEIDGIINQYKNKYRDLTVVLTGGDTIFLAKQLKNHIFANPNLVLEGLHKILIYNR